MDASRRFFPLSLSSNTVVGDSGPPLIQPPKKPEAIPVYGAKHIRYVITGEMLRTGGWFWRRVLLIRRL